MHQGTAIALLTAALLTHGGAQAQAASADRCRAYADAQEALAQRADAKACPEIKRRAGNWDGHFQWCMRQTKAKVDREQETYDAKFDGCMSAIEAAKTEKALADADRKAKADGQIGSYAQRWEKGVKRMADLGMTKPFHRQGYEFTAVSTEPKRWGAGLQKDQELGLYAVCDSCKGLTLRLLDPKGQVIQTAQTPGNAVEMTAYPKMAGKGSVEFTVTNCQSRDDSCKVKYTSFTLP